MSKLAFVLLALSVPAVAAADGGSVEGTVDAKPSKFLPDTIVYIKKVDGAKLTAKTIVIDQRGMTFTPHIAVGAVGDSVEFQNHDSVDHNVTSPEGGYDLGSWGQGKSKSQTFTKEGVFSQVCKIHPEMLAYVFVGQNRYAAVVDASGKFTIADVPPGSYELDVWNPKLKAGPQQITVTASKSTSVKFSLAR
jgi:plastocyanin